MMNEGFKEGASGAASQDPSDIAEILGFVFGESAGVNTQVFIAIAIAFFVFTSVLMVVILSLRRAAHDARDEILTFENTSKEEWPIWMKKIHQDGCFDKLRNMKFWPLAWPNLTMLSEILIVGILAILFYRISIVFIGLICAILVLRLIRYVLSFAK